MRKSVGFFGVLRKVFRLYIEIIAMAHVCTYQLRNGRFGRQVILEPPAESDAETESDDEETAIPDETASSSDDDDDDGFSSGTDEVENAAAKNSSKSTFRWGKCVIPEPNVSYRGCFKKIDNEIQLPVAYFRQIFDEKISQHIAEQTNIYSVQKQKSIATSGDEIDRYLGILLRMAIIPMPRYRMFWQTETVC